MDNRYLVDWKMPGVNEENSIADKKFSKWGGKKVGLGQRAQKQLFAKIDNKAEL